MPNAKKISTHVPRTVEILWEGKTKLGFTLKRKRSRAIQISSITPETQALYDLNLQSELKLVGGFPVQQLTLSEVKKVLLLAPKPVSLVFMNPLNLSLDFQDFIDMEAFPKSTSRRGKPYTRTVSSFSTSSNGSFLNLEDSFTSSGSQRSYEKENYYPDDERNLNKLPNQNEMYDVDTKKPTKLTRTLRRMSELLHRPVRRSALNLTTGKQNVL